RCAIDGWRRRRSASRLTSPSVALAVELLEIAVDAPLAERDAALGGEIGRNARALRDALVQDDDARHFALEPLHPLREGVAQALHDLEQREIDIAQPAPEHIGAAARAQQALEIAQVFRHAVTPEITGAALGCRPLLLVIEPPRHRMMGIVNLGGEVSDGELQLMQPQPRGLVARRKRKPRAEIKEDIGGLADDELAGLQERRRVGRALDAFAVEE